MDRKTRLSSIGMFASVGLSFLLTKTSRAGEEAKKIQAKEKFIITGTLVNEDGSPVTEGTVTLYRAAGSGYSVRADKEGILHDPEGKPDSKGQFKIEAGPESLGEKQEI